MPRHLQRRLAPLFLIGGMLLAGCAQGSDTTTVPADTPATPSGTSTAPAERSGQRFPDVVNATVTRSGTTLTVEATISSPYDTPERYADAFRARAPDGQVYGVRELLHDHADEQPFARSLTGLTLPPGVSELVVESRDKANGWGGSTVTATVPGP